MAKTAKKNLSDDEKPDQAATEPELSQPEPVPSQETMFEAAPEQPQDPPQPEAAPKRIGRPRKDDIPPPTIIDTIRGYPTWEGRYIYVYRIEPYINRKVGDNTLTHCAKYERAIDEQDLLNDLGSGVYQLRVVYDDPGPNGKREMVAKANVRVFNMQYPPRIPKIEAMWEDSRNKDWLWAKEMLDLKDAATVAKQVVQDSGTAMLTPFMEMMKEELRATRAELLSVRESSAQQIAAAQAAANKPDPNTQTLLAVLAPVIPELLKKILTPPPVPDPIAQLTAAIQLMKQTAPPPPAETKPADGLSALKEHLEVAKTLEEISPKVESTRRSKMEGWQEFSTAMAHELQPILAPIAQVIAMGIAEKQRQAMQQQAQQQQQPTQQQPRPRPQPNVAVMPTQQPAPPVAPSPKVPTDVDFAQEVLAALENSETGAMLAEWYAEEYGKSELADVQQQGKERLIADIRHVPGIQSALSSYDTTGALERLITEFLAYTPDDDEGNEDEPLPAAAAAPAPPQSNVWIQPASVEVQQ